MATRKTTTKKPAAPAKKAVAAKKPAAPAKPAREKKGREYATRGAAEEIRSERLQMRLRGDEKELFERASQKAGDLDAASWARRMLLAAARAELGLEA